MQEVFIAGVGMTRFSKHFEKSVKDLAVGASGIGQIHELVTQLRHEAGSRQVEGCRLALAENGGGSLSFEEAAMGIHILERM